MCFVVFIYKKKFLLIHILVIFWLVKTCRCCCVHGSKFKRLTAISSNITTYAIQRKKNLLVGVTYYLFLIFFLSLKSLKEIAFHGAFGHKGMYFKTKRLFEKDEITCRWFNFQIVAFEDLLFVSFFLFR